MQVGQKIKIDLQDGRGYILAEVKDEFFYFEKGRQYTGYTILANSPTGKQLTYSVTNMDFVKQA